MREMFLSWLELRRFRRKKLPSALVIQCRTRRYIPQDRQQCRWRRKQRSLGTRVKKRRQLHQRKLLKMCCALSCIRGSCWRVSFWECPDDIAQTCWSIFGRNKIRVKIGICRSSMTCRGSGQATYGSLICEQYWKNRQHMVVWFVDNIEMKEQTTHGSLVSFWECPDDIEIKEQTTHGSLICSRGKRDC